MVGDVSSDASASRIPVTVVVATRNEASNIAACIDSVRWADEIIVADDGSGDETRARASRAGASVLPVDNAPSIGAARNAAIARARNRWVLVVDADERGTADLARAVQGVVAGGGGSAYRVPRTNFFMGGEVKHGGWESDRPVRLFDRSLRYNESRVHEHVITESAPSTLAASLLHYPYASMDVYFEKFVRYSRWWAEDQARRGRRSSVTAIVLKPPARFLSMYIFRLGFLDGARGAVLASLAAASVCAKYIRLWALKCES
jgi:glycosyltransferase involved in cell wall biosynthesis